MLIFEFFKNQNLIQIYSKTHYLTISCLGGIPRTPLANVLSVKYKKTSQ